MNKDSVAKVFMKILRTNIGTVILLLITAIGVVVTSLLPPQLLKKIIDEQLSTGNYNGLLKLAVIYFVTILLIGAFDFAKEAILTVLGQKITREIRYAMMKKLTRLNHGYFTSNGTGTMVSRFMNDVDAISSMFSNGIVGMLIDCFKIIGIVISIWLFQARLGVITILLLPFISFVTRYFQKRMLKAQIENRILVAKVSNHIGESMKNVMTIKTFHKEAYMEQKYSEYLTENYKTVEKVNFYDSIFPPIIQITRAFIIGLIVVLAAPQLGFLGITVGMAAASIELISNLFAPVEQLGMEFQSIQQAFSGVRRVDEFLMSEEDNDKDQALTSETIIPEKTRVTLDFLGTSFRYDESADVLKDITLQIHPGEKVVFIGRTGVGKSTLFKLILGLLKPTAGCITVNGADVYQIPNTAKRQIFGYVDQSLWVLHATVAEQISLQDNTITREQIERAIDFVGMTDYVTALENGLETVVHDSMFSQGQKQLLAIARAIVTDPSILLLDEITSNLDSITEERIVTVLKKAAKDRILLTITHRLSSISDQDTVVVLEKGRIKSSGRAEQLKQKDDWYRSNLELENLTWS